MGSNPSGCTIIMKNSTIKYIQEGTYFDDEIVIDISVIPGNSDIVFLIIPGVDGSLDGYQDKYKTIAENINEKYQATVVRMSNPSNPMGYHYRNLFEVLDYIEKNIGIQNKKMHVMGHSLGAYMIGATAHLYDYIDKILLINPATGLDQNELSNLSERDKNQNIILVGDHDPSYKNYDEYSKYAKVYVIKGADHHFSGDSFTAFLNSAEEYLF